LALEITVAAEEIGKVSTRLRAALAISSVIFLIVLAVSPVKDYFSEWRRYQKSYARFAETRPDTKTLLADYHLGINQIWIPKMGVVDRCTTCHLGIVQPDLREASVPQPFRGHPPIPHHLEDWGCVVCHRGQGRATEVSEAHETTLAWEKPMLPIQFIQASCGVCHRADIPQTPKLNRGRERLVKFNCVGCHRLEGIERPAMMGPDLTRAGSKLSRAWIYKWLKEPATISDSQGNVVVDGYETEQELRMPKFRLDEKELRNLSAFLSSLDRPPIEPYKFDQKVLARWQRKSDAVDQGELRFRQMFCSDCHALAVFRAGTSQLIGGDIGPELTKVGSKVNRDWLIAWLRDPEAYLPHALMSRYNWSDEDLYTVSQYITTQLTDPDLLSDVPRLGPPAKSEIQLGRRLFVQKGCSSCHVIEGIPSQKSFGPDLSGLGSKTVSELYFGNAKIPHTLVAYIQAKISNPLQVNPAARMPQYHFSKPDLDAITTALLSMAGETKRRELAELTVPLTQTEFHPGGEFGRIYERYKCFVCHRFNGYGGTLAPDLSFEGSRAERRWLIDYVKNPVTLRPMLTVRMPQFNLKEQEAATITDYLEMVMQSPQIDKLSVNSKDFTPQMASLGKQLYEVKYQCQSCHTIGSTGGYVGPALTHAGDWMTPAWIEAWLRDPQALEPDTIEPRRNFTPEETAALTAYLLTLKQGEQSGASEQGRTR
jgi:mono/diheme cytochrome c family protein